MKNFIESIRTRFGDDAAHMATIYLLCRNIMLVAGNDNTDIITHAILRTTARKTNTSAALFILIAKEVAALNQIETLH